MNVEIWTGAAQFPEKENINGIFVAGGRILHVCAAPPTARAIYQIPHAVCAVYPGLFNIAHDHYISCLERMLSEVHAF